MRLPALRPQLKRDPLGSIGTPPPSMDAPDRLPEPQVWQRLLDSLDEYRDEHTQRLRAPENPEEESLHDAMKTLDDVAFQLLKAGVVPSALGDRLSTYQPGSPIENKILDLLQYDFVQHRVEFDVAGEVVAKLKGVGKRIPLSVIAVALLLRSSPSDTAVKYLHRTITLFLAGYDAEVVIMCGAVLEAAMTACVPDETLRAAGLKPAHRRTGVFSLTQRMEFEKGHPFLNDALRDEFWKAVNWRNDALHNQPDIGPSPGLAVLYAAHLLGAILPRARPI